MIFWQTLVKLLTVCQFVRSAFVKIVILQEKAMSEEYENDWQKYFELQVLDWEKRFGLQIEPFLFEIPSVGEYNFSFSGGNQPKGVIVISSCLSLQKINKILAEKNTTTLPHLSIVAEDCPNSTVDVIRLASATEHWPCFEITVAHWLMSVKEIVMVPNMRTSIESSGVLGNCGRSLHIRNVPPRDKSRDGQKWLKRANLKVTSMELIPYQIRLPDDKDGQIRFTGLSHDVFGILVDKYQITYKIVEPPEYFYGSSVNGTWNGMEADIAVCGFATTYERSKAIDFSWPFFEDPSAILIPPPQEESKIWACTKPFDMNVWFLLIGSTVVIGKILHVVMSLSWKYVGHLIANVCKPVHRMLSTQYLFLIGIMLSHANTCPAYSHSSRVLAAAWCVGALVLVNMYTSVLMSFLTIPKIQPMADSIEDVAYNGRLLLTLWKSSSYDTMMMGATSGTYKVFGDYLRKHPEDRVPNMDMAIAKVLTGKYAYTLLKINLDHVIHRHWKNHRKCKLTLARKTYENNRIAFVLPKRSPYRAVINDEIRRFHETGLIDYWTRRVTPPKNPCMNMLEVTPTGQPLKIDDLQSAFLAMALGFGLAVIAFVTEHLFKPCKKAMSLSCTGRTSLAHQ